MGAPTYYLATINGIVHLQATNKTVATACHLSTIQKPTRSTNINAVTCGQCLRFAVWVPFADRAARIHEVDATLSIRPPGHRP